MPKQLLSLVSAKKRMLNHKIFATLTLSLIAVCFIVQLPQLLQVSAQPLVESDFVAILNAERATLGKTPVAINSCLSTAAYLHSQDMAEQNYFSHTSLDGRTFDQRIVAEGYTDYVSLSENIAYAYGAPDAARVYEMWENSPGHFNNMMGDFNEAGLGVYSKNGYTYYTLDLGKSRSATSPAPSSTPVPTPTPSSAPTPTPTPNSGPTPTPTDTLASPTPTPEPPQSPLPSASPTPISTPRLVTGSLTIETVYSIAAAAMLVAIIIAIIMSVRKKQV